MFATKNEFRIVLFFVGPLLEESTMKVFSERSRQQSDRFDCMAAKAKLARKPHVVCDVAITIASTLLPELKLYSLRGSNQRTLLSLGRSFPWRWMRGNGNNEPTKQINSHLLSRLFLMRLLFIFKAFFHRNIFVSIPWRHVCDYFVKSNILKQLSICRFSWELQIHTETIDWSERIRFLASIQFVCRGKFRGEEMRSKMEGNSNVKSI